MPLTQKKRALSRLQRDYASLQQLSARGVLSLCSAAPLAVIKEEKGSMSMIDDWFKWHINIMAPPSSPYCGTLVSIDVDFPVEYPEKGPRASICTYLNHEHVYDNWICLSILDDFISSWGEHGGTDEDKKNEAWSYGYSMEGILVQLQSFLFDEDKVDGVSLDGPSIARCFLSALDFKREDTGHCFLHPVPFPGAWSSEIAQRIVTLSAPLRAAPVLESTKFLGKIREVLPRQETRIRNVKGSRNLTYGMQKYRRKNNRKKYGHRGDNTSDDSISTLSTIEDNTYSSQWTLTTSIIETDILLAPATGAVSGIVEEIDESNGVLLREKVGSKSQARFLSIPRCEVIEVRWEGTEMKLAFSVTVGQKLNVYPSTRHRKWVNNGKRPLNCFYASLEAPRPATIHRELQRKLVCANPSLVGVKCAGNNFIVKKVRCGVLVCLDTLCVDGVKFPLGLVGLINNESWGKAKGDQANTTKAAPGERVIASLWITSINVSNGQIGLSFRNPKCNPNERDATDVSTNSTMNGEVVKFVASLASKSLKRQGVAPGEYALIVIARGVTGALSLHEVRRTVKEFHLNGKNDNLRSPPRMVWQLSEVLRQGDELDVVVLDSNGAKGTSDDPLLLGLPTPKRNLAIPAEDECVADEFPWLDDYLMFHIFSFLDRADLATLRENFSHRLASLADRSTARRFATENFCCAFTRENFRSEGVILGMGMQSTTHTQRHMNEAEAYRKSACEPLTAENYDDSNIKNQILLNDWLIGIIDNEQETLARAAARVTSMVQTANETAEDTGSAAKMRVRGFAISDEAERSKQNACRNASDLDTVTPCFGSLVSLQAWRCGVKRTPWRAPFNFWLPVWIDRYHGSRATSLAISYASSLVLGSETALSLRNVMLPIGLEEKDATSEQMTLLLAFSTLVTKAMNSTVVGMMKGGLHESVVALEGYFLLYQLLLGVSIRYPALLSSLRRRVRQFCFGDVSGKLSLEQCRGKAEVPSLGELLPLLPLAGLKWDEVVEPVVNEAFVRNARWAIKKFPELADIQDGSNFSSGASSNADQKRLRLTFQANVVSLQLLSFHCTAADVVLADTGGNDAKSQAARLELVLGVPSSRAALRLQQATALLKTMDSWEQFFNDGVQLSPAPSSRFLAQWLRRAIDRSGARGYHNQRRALRLLRDKRIRHKLNRSNEESEENGKIFEYNDFAMAS